MICLRMLCYLMILFSFYNKNILQHYFHGYFTSHVPKLQSHFIVKLLLPETS